MIIFGADKSKLMEVNEIARSGGNLTFRGKIMGAMPVSGVVTPAQARALIRMLDLRTLLFVISLPFRRSND